MDDYFDYFGPIEPANTADSLNLLMSDPASAAGSVYNPVDIGLDFFSPDFGGIDYNVPTFDLPGANVFIEETGGQNAYSGSWWDQVLNAGKKILDNVSIGGGGGGGGGGAIQYIPGGTVEKTSYLTGGSDLMSTLLPVAGIAAAAYFLLGRRR